MAIIVSPLSWIEPSIPTLVAKAHRGPDWRHEIRRDDTTPASPRCECSASCGLKEQLFGSGKQGRCLMPFYL
jgi:hypothetical protein